MSLFADQTDWSDHAFWWPEKNQWLMRTRSTLDQCHVQADAALEFTPMHKALRVQMPDMQIIEMKVDFSGLVFNAVQELARDIGKQYLSICIHMKFETSVTQLLLLICFSVKLIGIVFHLEVLR